MTSKERMMIALNLGKPDRVPATIHQWLPFHLKYHMGGKSEIEAFRHTGLDAAISVSPIIEKTTGNWKTSTVESNNGECNITDYTIKTPDGNLTYQIEYNEVTPWFTQRLIKNDEDIFIIKKYRPVPSLDKNFISKTYDEVGDDGIIRSFCTGNQGGCWQDACAMYGTEEMIMATFDKPEWVHEFLNILLEQKLQFIEESLKGARVDLIETGGGAASSNVISPSLYKEFCLPYDRKMHNALHNIGFKAVYHTCGGMIKILDLI
ncbi:MAG: uroporphyrinogen decarboxylase family protein, partial [Clostridiales bacterium]|nr:uroporphyrinogen decarboxylase family protein [Clostridiales bacterium]